MTPRQVVEIWVEAFNRADAFGLAGMYLEGAINHQVAHSGIAQSPSSNRFSGIQTISAAANSSSNVAWITGRPERLHGLPHGLGRGS